MANIPAAQSGNFALGTTWVSGVVPGSGDVAFANGFTVTIDDARTVQAISTASEAGIIAGGVFSLLNGADFSFSNASGIINGSTSAAVISTASLGPGATAVVSGPSVTPTLTFRGPAIEHNGSGALDLVTNISAETNQVTNNSGLVLLSGPGTLNTTGSIVGPVSTTVNQNGAAIWVSGNGNLSHSGSVTGGSNAAGTFPNGQSAGIFIAASNASVTVNGSVTGGSAAYNPGIVNNNSSSLTVNGTCTSSATAPAIGVGNVNQNTRLSGPFLLGASGNINPVQAQSWRWAPTQVPTFMQVAQSNGSTLRLLYTADNNPEGGYPVVANVRQYTVYGPNLEFEGTLAVPTPSSVAVGVNTDNTVGTAVLTGAAAASAVWGADSRTLTSGGGSAPTVGEIRAEMDANSTRLASLAEQMANKASVDQVAAIVQGATTE